MSCTKTPFSMSLMHCTAKPEAAKSLAARGQTLAYPSGMVRSGRTHGAQGICVRCCLPFLMQNSFPEVGELEHCHCPATYKGWECTTRLCKSPALPKVLLQRHSPAEQSQAAASRRNLLLEKRKDLFPTRVQTGAQNLKKLN